MDEACADVRIFRCAQVKHIVHDAVAYVGACGEGYVARKAVFADVLNHCFDRNRCKVCGRAVCLQRFIGRLLSGVVRDSCVCKVDADFLYGYACASACLSDIDDNVRIVLFDGCFHTGNTSGKLGRDLNFYDLCSGDGIRQKFDSLECRVHALSSKWVKSC